jgi:Tfp pilus assembly protein PilN
MIKELPQSKKQEFKQWCIFTGILSGIIFCSLTIITAMQMRTFIITKNKNIMLQEQLKKNENTLQSLQHLQNKQKKLSEKKAKLQKFKDRKNYFDILLSIAQIMPNEIVLNQFSAQKKELDFSGFALNQQAIGQFLTKIKTVSTIKNVALLSLQQTEKQQFSFSIKAHLI